MIRVELGDLVRVGGIWNGLVGIVQATEKAPYVIKDHLDVKNCIVSKNDITKIVKKRAVPKKYVRYL